MKRTAVVVVAMALAAAQTASGQTVLPDDRLVPVPPYKETGDVTPPYETVKLETTPRASRWRPMEASYLQANVCHPPLYYNSVQEPPTYDPAMMRNLAGIAAAGFYEIVQFPVQVALTPALMVIKPVWQAECEPAPQLGYEIPQQAPGEEPQKAVNDAPPQPESAKPQPAEGESPVKVEPVQVESEKTQAVE